MLTNSFFSKVSAASVLAAGGIGVKGVAWTGGGRGICRVEVSLDGGRHFEPAHLTRTLEQAEGKEPTCVNCPAPTPEMGMGRNYAWCQYKRFVKLPEGLADRLVQGEKVELELVCKAVDGDMNQQPEKMTDNWNVLGIAVNHWHRVNVTIDPSLRPGKEPAPPISPGPGQWFDSENNSWERD
jgi:sulfite oxidase